MAKTKREQPKGPVPVTINGRTFVLEDNPSFEQDMYIMDLTDKIGLSSGQIAQLDDANLMQLTEKIVLDAYRSGNMFALLGALMVDQNNRENWNPEIAEDTAEIFKRVRDRETREKLERNMVFMLLAFFATGLSSSKISLSYSDDGDKVESESKAEEPSTSGIGSPSSGSLREVIQAANERSRRGQSGKGS